MPAVERASQTPFLGCQAHRLALFVRHMLGIDEIDGEENPRLYTNKLKVLMRETFRI